MNNNIIEIKTKTHIVVISSYFYPKIGGVENYAYLLAKNLVSTGNYTISIITSKPEGEEVTKKSFDSMTVYYLPTRFKISNTPINLQWYSYVKKILDVEKPDLIHAHSPVPYLPDIAAWAGNSYPLVLTYHSGSMLKGAGLIDIVIGIYEKIFLRKLFHQAKAIVAVSEKFARQTFPEYNEKIYFIPTGVDLQRFRKTPLPHTENITFVGRIEHSSSWKGIEPLLLSMVQVLKSRPSATLELVGGGDAIAHFQNRAKELDISHAVIFSGPLLGKDLVAAYERSKMVVLPSISESEAFSVTLIEAMASGRPIIGTSIGGTPQVIDNGKNGLLVPPNDPNALANAIIRVLENNEFAIDLAKNGAERSIHYSWDIQGKKYSDLFQKVLKSGTHTNI